VSRCLRPFLFSARVQVLRALGDEFLFVIALVQPFAIGLAAIFMLRHRADFEAVYAVVGAGLTALFSLILFGGTGTITNLRFSGNLEHLVAAPVPLIVVVGGQIMGSVALVLVPMLVSYGLGAWLFGYPIAIRDPAGFTVSVLLALLSLWAMGLLFAPLAILWPAVNSVLGALEYPVYVLCGFLFPVLLLPGWLQPLGQLLAPYWAAYALHGTSSGSLTAPELALAWLLLLALTAATLVLAAWLFDLFLARAQRDGSLAAL